jgi:predicted enzyme related to lactoylglutathione lyase
MQNNPVRFIEIPVSNLTRATNFYTKVLDLKLDYMEMGKAKLAMFFVDSDKTNGALVQGDGYVPSTEGALIYFSAGENMQSIIDSIPKAGGTVTMEKSSLAGHGFTARFIDTEGNKIALHSEI